MKKILLLAFALLFCSYFVNAQITGTIGTVEANSGDVVYIPVTFNGLNGDNSPIAIDFKFDYDNTQLAPVGTGFANYCTQIPQSDWLPNPNYGPNTMSNNMALINPVSVPDGTKIFDLVFTYTGSATANVIFNLETILFNGNFDELQPVYTNGGVTPLSIPPPLAPVLLSPVNELANVTIDVTLEWNASLTATGYNIEISDDPTFATTIALQSTTTTVNVLGLNYLTPYYWRVNAYNNGGTSDWSEVWMFTTMDEVPTVLTGKIFTVEADLGATVYVPVYFWKLNGANAPIAIDFKFDYDNTQLTPVGTGFANYCTQIPQSDWLPNPNYGPNTMSNNMALINPVEVPDGTKLFDLVFTYNGATTAPVTFNLETILFNGNFDELQPVYINGAVNPGGTPPLPPVLLSPIDGSVDMPNPLEFTWMASEGATNYYIEFSDVADFSNAWGEWTTATSYIEDFWYYGETYYWRVKASNGLLESGWSEVWDVTIRDFGVPTLLSPIDEAADVVILPYALLTWEGLAEATAYNIEVSTDPTFAISTPYQVAETSLEVTGLDYYTTYYWRVSGYNNYQTGEWSTVWMFTT
ncbi:MAG TPA: cohesin domain-containing protein, partial [Candidatus Kapabacteria bacterium]|nr:cohesin domain-containing protein [Candidatus Kapabacteria bacterium]